jgi:uncharacterized protein YkwD
MNFRGVAFASIGALLASTLVTSHAGARPAGSAHSSRARHASNRRHSHRQVHTSRRSRTIRAQPRCADADTPASAASAQAMRDAVVCLINQQRQGRHLPPLSAHRDLDRSAQQWTNVMVSNGQFSHGSNFAARISAAGFVWSAAGENIATGYQTPRQVVAAWMASTDHCQNILSPTYANVGTGVSTHRLGPYGPSTWTQDFGRWIGHAAPSQNRGPAGGCPYRG